MTSIQRSATIAGTREVHEPLEAKEAIETVEEAVGRNISTRFPLNSAFIFTFGALGGMLFGFDTGIISGASPLIESDFGLSVSQTGFITSSVLIGSCVGALSIGTLSDRFGRKKLLILSAILFLIGSGMCATATGFLMMVAHASSSASPSAQPPRSPRPIWPNLRRKSAVDRSPRSSSL